jgi:hypothetical protein
MTSGFGVTPWLRSVASGDWLAVDRAIGYGRARFGLGGDALVVSCVDDDPRLGRHRLARHRSGASRGGARTSASVLCAAACADR